MHHLLPHSTPQGNLSPNRLAWVMVGLFLSAWLLHYVGFETILGAFVYGLVFPRGHGTSFLYTVLSRVEAFSTIVLLPVFFIVTGLCVARRRGRGERRSSGLTWCPLPSSVNLALMTEPGAGAQLGYVLLVAVGGKFVGAGLTARLTGSGWREAGALGVLMNTRGLTEIVVLNIVKSAGILDDLVRSPRADAAAADHDEGMGAAQPAFETKTQAWLLLHPRLAAS